MRTNGNLARNTQMVSRLERDVSKLRREAVDLRNAIEEKDSRLNNSLFSLMQGAQAQSELTSFNPIAANNVYAPLTINWTMLTFLYKTHGIIQTAVDMPVEDALRGGLEFHSDELDKDDIDQLTHALEDMDFYHTIKMIEIWARLYGGAAAVINTDASSPEKALNPKEIANGRFKIYAANRWELISPQRFAETYTFYGVRVHSSRVLTTAGKDAPYIIRWVLQNWGMSVVEHMVEPLNIYLRGENVVYDLLKEAKVDIYRFKNFNSQLATQKGTDMTLHRVALMNQAKSSNNAMMMDSEDEYEQKQITFSGLPDILKENRMGLACALRIPMAKLFGISASGFNSGEDDIENYIGMIESEVREHMKPMIKQLLDMVQIAVFGDIYDLHFDFKPLRVLSSVDEENIKTQKHNRYLSLYSQGLLTAQEIMELEQKEKLVPIETEVASGAMPEPPQYGNEEGGEKSGDDGDDGGDGEKDKSKKKEKETANA